MDERAAKVFPLDATEPRASGMGAVASGQPSNQHTLFVWEAAGRLCDAHRPALSRAYGNFDRVVAAGWLMGDTLEVPHLDRKQACSLGFAVRKRAGTIEAKIASIRKAATAKGAAADARQTAARKEATHARD